MSSNALQHFNFSLNEAMALIDCYHCQNKNQQSQGVLKRASLIMVITAWETYVENVATELFNNKYQTLLGSQAGTLINARLRERLKQFHNPDVAKTKALFKEFFNIDVTEHWTFEGYTTKQAKDALNKWIKTRGVAVHQAPTNQQKTHIIKRPELLKCITFFRQLALATDGCLMHHHLEKTTPEPT